LLKTSGVQKGDNGLRTSAGSIIDAVILCDRADNVFFFWRKFSVNSINHLLRNKDPRSRNCGRLNLAFRILLEPET
jgi:hypothetical protein